MHQRRKSKHKCIVHIKGTYIGPLNMYYAFICVDIVTKVC